MVRTLQEGRKTAGLDVADRISVTWSSDDPDLADAIRTHTESIAGEVLATTFAEGLATAGMSAVETDLPVALAITRA